MKCIYQSADIIVNLAQTEVHGRSGCGFRRSVLDGREFHIVKPDDAVADGAVAGIDAKDNHSCLCCDEAEKIFQAELL